METEEIKTEVQTNETGKTESSTEDYIAAIKELKQKSVDRSEYEKLRADNQRLLNELVNGQTPEKETEDQVVMPTDDEIAKLRKDLYKSDCDFNSLEYVKKTLELRNALILRGEPDSFLPISKRYNASQEEIDIANKAARIYQECIDYAKGDAEAFTTELMRRTKDVRVR